MLNCRCTSKSSTPTIFYGGEYVFVIDSQSKVPVFEQIINQTEEFILKGILLPGDPMPSVRKLSLTLSINPNTVQKSFNELDNRGLIYSLPGRGCFISENAKEIVSEKKKDTLSDLRNLMSEYKLAGVPVEKIQKIVDEVYGEGK